MNIARYIDHTILKPTTTLQEVMQLCAEAKEYGFAAVCIPPYFIRQAKHALESTGIKTATVIGFPFGYSSTPAKLEEIKNALSDGADELDIVHNLAALKHRDWNYLEHEITTATKMVHEVGKQIKVIIESGILEDDEIVKCCELYGNHHIDFMKTSTGYAATGATLHAVQLMRKNLPADMGIKASGGIRNFAFAIELVDAGATRLGCSASVQIVKEAENKQ